MNEHTTTTRRAEGDVWSHVHTLDVQTLDAQTLDGQTLDVQTLDG